MVFVADPSHNKTFYFATQIRTVEFLLFDLNLGAAKQRKEQH